MKEWLRVDVRPLKREIDELRSVLSRENLNKCISMTVLETGDRMRTQVARAVRKDYNVNYGYVIRSITPPRVTRSKGEVGCVLDVNGARLDIPNSGGGDKRRKRAIYIKPGLKARIAKIEEPLPTSGPKAHYVLRKSGKVITFTGGEYTLYEKFHTKNATEKLYPSKKKTFRQGVGIAVPQMPMNRSAEAIQEWAQATLVSRLNHYVIAMGKGYIKGA